MMDKYRIAPKLNLILPSLPFPHESPPRHIFVIYRVPLTLTEATRSTSQLRFRIDPLIPHACIHCISLSLERQA